MATRSRSAAGSEALAHGRRSARGGSVRVQIDGSERGRGSRRQGHDSVAEAHVRELHLHRAVGEKAGLGGHGGRGVEAVDRAPGHGERVRGRGHEDPAARRRIEVGEEGAHARGAREQARDPALVLRGVGAVERDVAVRVHEEAGVALAVVGKREGERGGEGVVVAQGEPCPEVGPEAGIDVGDVVAARGVANEAEALAREVEGVRGQDQAAVVLDHRDVPHVGGGGGAARFRPGPAHWPPRSGGSRGRRASRVCRGPGFRGPCRPSRRRRPRPRSGPPRPRYTGWRRREARPRPTERVWECSPPTRRRTPPGKR